MLFDLYTYSNRHTKKTMKRYWDFSIPSAEVHPTAISKVIDMPEMIASSMLTVMPLGQHCSSACIDGCYDNIASYYV